MQERLESKVLRDWHLNNPHLWADKVVGRDLYERHILEGGEWLGWQPQQIAFLTDLCDWDIPKIIVITNRGGSKTWLTAVGATCLIDNSDKLRVSVVSGSFDQASVCYDYMSDIFNNTSLLHKVDGDVTLKKTRFIGGGIVRVLPASTKRTKAPRSDIIIIDESCETTNEIIDSVLPQVITAVKMKIVVLTTPDDVLHRTKQWWDEAVRLGFVRYHWNAFDCAWIPHKNIKEFYNLYDEATYQIYIMANWASKAGHPFKYADLMASLIDMSELPLITEMDRFFAGIDWGDAHETVITIMGMRGSVADGTDEWYVFDQEVYQDEVEDLMIFGSNHIGKDGQALGPNKKGEMIRGIVEICDFYAPTVWSENSPVGKYPNKKLRPELTKRGITMHLGVFTGKKQMVVRNLVGTVEKLKLKIPRRFRKLIEQLVNYHYKEVGGIITEEFEKKEDDHVDSIVWTRWGIHPADAIVEKIGEWNF